MSLAFRSALLRQIRAYFYRTGAIEVVTPTLRQFGTNDPHLNSFELTDFAAGASGYLQTSPEHAMKCLLAADPRDMFQICPAYRKGESGARHQQEFQMLEWYRCGASLDDLIADVRDLLAFVCSTLAEAKYKPGKPLVTTYRELFEFEFGVNPHGLTLPALKYIASIDHLDERASEADYFDALFAARIEPRLIEPTIVVGYPACQSALATVSVNSAGDRVSNRFELFIAGTELANAYHELTDAKALRARFEANNLVRESLGLPVMPVDAELLAATLGMPECSGIALGIDRLMMVLSGASALPSPSQ